MLIKLAKWYLNRSQFGIRIDHDLAAFFKVVVVDSIGQRNSYVKTWGCGGFLNETNIYSRGKSLCF
ncbi:hypothetical protein DP942_24850 [Escherichia coli]|nr:hypothetical protein [Escherichia coli]EFC4030778.1 hypothetical protein [Escherichia coli]EFO3187935.1 hypothetical protein [Escherichia coli]MFB66917.1 hypothetical protein [Escherichia coli]